MSSKMKTQKLSPLFVVSFLIHISYFVRFSVMKLFQGMFNIITHKYDLTHKNCPVKLIQLRINTHITTKNQKKAYIIISILKGQLQTV